MSFPKFDPEQLDETAERLATSGATDVATTLRLCAEAWRRDQQALHEAQTDNTALQRRITEAQRTLRQAA